MERSSITVAFKGEWFVSDANNKIIMLVVVIYYKYQNNVIFRDGMKKKRPSESITLKINVFLENKFKTNAVEIEMHKSHCG